MKTPTLREVLWAAQSGACWICELPMRQLKTNHHPRACTLDHLWPRKQYGAIGDTGITLLACRSCNEARGHKLPTDSDIRTLIAIYRRIPSWWLSMAQRDAEIQAKNARAFAIRRDICSLFARAA